VCPHLGQVAFGALGEAPVEVMRDHEPKHAVAQELEPFVGVFAPLHPRGVGEGKHAKVLWQAVDQRPQRAGRRPGISCG
jgi:hypothetical protein